MEKPYKNMSKIEINEIPMDRKLTGYLWMSDEQEPRVLEDCSIVQSNCSYEDSPVILELGTNPFIVEAELWDAEACVSYAIHHAGNEIVCQRYDVRGDDIGNPDNRLTVFISHRMAGRKLHFLEYWEPKDSIIVAGINGKADDEVMPSLVMTRRVFIGFTPLYIN
ncbi:MAG TPA: TIGR04423 family type III CRISPR-associated protein [Prevotella sp.]|nr:TIGR04423 family type III CRISPR-associated protein [Prevotella sp.]